MYAVFLTAQAAFWGVAFVAVPSYLAIIKPDDIALLLDPRLVQSSYDSLLTEVLAYVAISQVVFVTILAIFAKRLQSRGTEAARWEAPDSSALSAMWVMWSIGWAGRALTIIGVRGFESATEPFASAASSLLIIYASFRDPRRLPPIPLALLCAEGAWAVVEGSKSAFIVPLVALLIRWAISPRLGRLSPLTALSFAGVLISGFLLLQSLKGVTTDSKAYIRVETTGSWVGSMGVGLLERFDGVSAMTDAVAAQDASGWISLSEYLGRIVFNLLPKGPWSPVTESIGQQWTREVRSQSVPHQFQDVPLAAGFPAEGMALGGVAGLIFFTVVLAFITVAAIRLFHTKRIGWQIFISPVLFSPILFEQGLLGVAGAINKGVQLFVVYAIAAFVFSSIGRSRQDHAIARVRKSGVTS